MDIVSELEPDLKQLNDENKKEFFSDIENGEINYFLGAGVSSISEWGKAIESICNKANITFNPNRKNDPEYLKNIANEFTSKETLAFVKEEFSKFSPLIKQVYLPILNSDFRFLLTTNFDSEISKIIYTGLNSSDFNIQYYPILWRVLTNENKESKKNIIHIHGLLSDGNTNAEDVVLSSNNFATAYNKTSLKSILLYLFTNYSFFFYGFNIGESEIKSIIDQALEIVHHNTELAKKYNHSENKPRSIKMYKLQKFDFNEEEINKEASINNTSIPKIVNQKIREWMSSHPKSSFFKILIYNEWEDFDSEFVDKKMEITKNKEKLEKIRKESKKSTALQNPKGPEVD